MYSGGLSLPTDVTDILARPGFIASNKGGHRLATFYTRETAKLDPFALSPLGLAIYFGQLIRVKSAMKEPSVPDLSGTETPLRLGYAIIAVMGAQRASRTSAGGHRYLETLEYLLSDGLPPDVEDILGLTALHHAASSDRPQIELARCLLENGANANHQNRFGSIPIMAAMSRNSIPAVNLLMEYRSQLNIADADGCTIRNSCVYNGPQVTAVINKWDRKQTGKTAPREDKQCDVCGVSPPSLMNCARCVVARYCSKECQAKAWTSHKTSCQPFTNTNTVTLHPWYDHHQSRIVPDAALKRLLLGYETSSPEFTNVKKMRASHVPKIPTHRSKMLIIKVQIPFIWPASPRTRIVDDWTNTWDPDTLRLYTKKRDFACSIRRSDAPEDYDRILSSVRERGTGSVDGTGGVKAYFAAELQSKDRVVVKISETLAEQPW
ncbi:hypothetical protein C8R47DRAFT_969851 [Mycena vitilis]|nr:hypothetical protein C8R47DRAFT_969851 [Mycena vitilis]